MIDPLDVAVKKPAKVKSAGLSGVMVPGVIVVVIPGKQSSVLLQKRSNGLVAAVLVRMEQEFAQNPDP